MLPIICWGVIVLLTFKWGEQIICDWEKKDLNKKELLKYHKSFPILVFEEDLSIKKRILVQVINFKFESFPPLYS